MQNQKEERFYHGSKKLIKKLEAELRQAHQSYLEGKCIPLEEFDWGLPQFQKKGGLIMDRKSILKKFEDELRESHQNYLEGKGIPLEEFDWGSLQYVTEQVNKSFVQNKERKYTQFCY